MVCSVASSWYLGWWILPVQGALPQHIYESDECLLMTFCRTKYSIRTSDQFRFAQWTTPLIKVWYVSAHCRQQPQLPVSYVNSCHIQMTALKPLSPWVLCMGLQVSYQGSYHLLFIQLARSLKTNTSVQGMVATVHIILRYDICCGITEHVNILLGAAKKKLTSKWHLIWFAYNRPLRATSALYISQQHYPAYLHWQLCWYMCGMKHGNNVATELVWADPANPRLLSFKSHPAITTQSWAGLTVSIQSCVLACALPVTNQKTLDHMLQKTTSSTQIGPP